MKFDSSNSDIAIRTETIDRLGKVVIGSTSVSISKASFSATVTPPIVTYTPPQVHINSAELTNQNILRLVGRVNNFIPIESIQILCGKNVLAQTVSESRDANSQVKRSFNNNYSHVDFVFERPIDRNLIVEDHIRAAFYFEDGTFSDVEIPIELLPLVVEHKSPQSGSAPVPMHISLENCRVNGRGVLRVSGWVASLSPIRDVQVFLDNRLIGVAEKNIQREDVESAYPEYPGSQNSGFLLEQVVDDSELTTGDVRVVVTALGGITRQAFKALQIAPVIKRRKHQDAPLRIECDSLELREDGTLSVDGWAICQSGVESIGIELDKSHIDYAEVGLSRPDVGNHFPLVPSARQSGFKFTGKIAASCKGESSVTLTLRGIGGEEHRVLLPVMAVATGAPDAPESVRNDIFVFVDTPAIQDGLSTSPARGGIMVVGWALSLNEIVDVEVFVDDVSIGLAYYGMRREDIHAAFPTIAKSLLSGFAVSIPQRFLDKGRHIIRAVAKDKHDKTAITEFAIDAEEAAVLESSAIRRRITQAEFNLQDAVLNALRYNTKYALFLLVKNGNRREIDNVRTTVKSLTRQVYGDWTLTIILSPGIFEDAFNVSILSGITDDAGKIKVVSADENVTLSQMLCTTPEVPLMFSLLRPGDEIGVDALLEMSVASGLNKNADFLYSDERRFDVSSGTQRAYFKPEWSPDLLLSTNYIGGIWIADASLLTGLGVTVGDIRSFGEYDLVLRLTESARLIWHHPKVLCESKERRHESSGTETRALRRALKRRRIDAKVIPGCIPGIYRVKREVQTDGLVSIIIPTIAARGLVKITIDSIREKTNYQNFEIICIDNIPRSEKPEWKRWLRENADSVISIPDKFNWSKFNNRGAAKASGEFLLFLNDDIEVTDPYWLDALLEHAQRDDVGIVGPQLRYPDGKVQHAGLFLTRVGARHAFRFFAADDPGPFGMALTQRNVIGVTGACMLMRRDAFDAVGGFDESHSVVNNDVDYCLSAGIAGQKIIYTPHAQLIHHELASRAEMTDAYDKTNFTNKWGKILKLGDPYFSPLMSIERDDYSPEDEPVRVIHAGHPITARNSVKRILAVKVDHIGDFITAIPALTRLKDRFPGAKLSVLTPRASVSMASMVPAIDSVIEFNFFHARSGLGKRSISKKEISTLTDTLRSYDFDIAVDLRRQPDTRHLLQYSGATWLVGFDRGSQFPWLDVSVEWEGDTRMTGKRAQVSDALSQLVETLALACDGDRTVLPSIITQAAARAAVAALPAVAPLAHTLFSGPLVCVHPSVGTTTRQWPPEHFAGLIDLLVDYGASVILIGGPDEIDTATQVMRHVSSTNRVFSLVGKTALQDLQNILQACDLFVGNNSGPHHIAAAIGVPTVGIHSGVVDAREWGPLGPAAIAVRRETNCFPCYAETTASCHRGMACLHGIHPGDVYRACQRLLALRAEDRPKG